MSSCVPALTTDTEMGNKSDRDVGLRGGCPCGNIRYRTSGRPLIVHCCHCTSCKTETGSAFSLSGVFLTRTITREPSIRHKLSPQPKTAITTEEEEDSPTTGLASPNLTHSLNATASPTASGYPHTLLRCSLCQATVWSHYAGAEERLAFLKLGTVDSLGQQDLEPDVHIYVRSKLPWVALPAGAKAYDEFYDFGAVWGAVKGSARERALGEIMDGGAKEVKEEEERLGEKEKNEENPELKVGGREVEDDDELVDECGKLEIK